jgi:hypothetical protein
MVQNPMFKNGLVDGVFHLAKDQIPDLVSEYVMRIETERTNDWCKCEWLVHPDDEDLDIHNCGNCHHPSLLHHKLLIPGTDQTEHCVKQISYDFDEDDECDCTKWIDPPKRRLRRGDQHPQCPVHTKEGFILGFFEWVFAEPSPIQLNPIISKEDAKQLVDQFKEKYDIPPELP